MKIVPGAATNSLFRVCVCVSRPELTGVEQFIRCVQTGVGFMTARVYDRVGFYYVDSMLVHSRNTSQVSYFGQTNSAGCKHVMSVQLGI